MEIIDCILNIVCDDFYMLDYFECISIGLARGFLGQRLTINSYPKGSNEYYLEKSLEVKSGL